MRRGAETHILSLLEKYKHIEPDETAITRTVRTAIKEIADIDIEEKDVVLNSGGSISLLISPIKKHALQSKYPQIIKKCKEIDPTRSIVRIV